jgi:eukaryotic-like serine/threonine-protein kinase
MRMGSDVEASAAPLIGRTRELATLLDGLTAAEAGHPRLFLVAGEPGIGKSRLLEEFGRQAAARQAAVLWGRCWEAGGAPPYWPWVQSLRTFVRGSHLRDVVEELGADAVHLAQLLPELHEAAPDLPDPPAVDPETGRFLLFDAAVSFLRAASTPAPIVLMLDDLHAADTPSLLLLRFVARELRGARVVLVAAYRDTELAPGHPMLVTVGELTREAVTRRVALDGIPEGELAPLVEAVAHVVPSPELVAAIHRDTEGNPLFVGEVVRLLSAQGVLASEIDPVTWPRTVPESVREVIGRRLALLSEPCTEALHAVSVLGRDFRLDAAEGLTGSPRNHLLGLLEEAESAGVVAPVPGSLARRRFGHALVREVLYANLGAARRAALHGRAGELLEGLYGSQVESRLAELAHHFFQAAQAGEASRAVAYARRAGDRAAELLAHEEAVRLYSMALEALDLAGADDADRCDLLLSLGDVQARAGDGDAARGTFLAAAGLARRLGRAEELARAALGYGGRFVWEAARGDPNLVPLLEDAVGSLGDADSGLRARVLARLAGGPLRDQVDRGPRDRLSAEAVDIARRLGDPATLAYVLDGRYAAVWWPENLEERLEIATELVDMARRAGDRERELQGHHYRCLALLELGDMDGVNSELESKARLAEELRQPAQRWYLESVQVTLATFQGRFDEAESMLPRAHEVGLRAEGAMADVYQVLQLYSLRREQERLGEIVDQLEGNAGRFASYPVLRCILAQTYVELGRGDEATRLLRALADGGFSALPRNDEWVYSMSILAEVATQLGDVEVSDELYEQLRPFAHRQSVSAPDACTGSVSRNLGLLAATAGRWDDAVRHLRNGLESNRRTGARPWAARCAVELARVLLAAEGDRDEAVRLVRTALDEARALGMPRLVSAGREVLQQAGVVDAVAERMSRAFMFTDIVKSTSLLEAMGDDAWEDLRRWHDRMLRTLFSEHGGEEVDHAGDGFFVAFRDPGSALRCAIGIQRGLAEHRRSHGFAPSVRIGIHAGEASGTEEGYAGHVVHAAARVGGAAQGGEILATDIALAGTDVAVTDQRELALKGISSPIKARSVDWRVESQT